ncbi:TetR/AcrR family transcriptional regulator [Pinisolibacter sp.]|uniref:TetR/AcrR family transcriptional regulator n=1 Tax=Pinisolibacter sp. TaxID=2172024 RepID=UPI002FDE4659
MSTRLQSRNVDPRETETVGEEAGVFGVGHSDEKARQILDGARTVFLRDGFDGASVADVARAAGVSKGTLYAYWPSKEELFVAFIRHDKRQQAERTCMWGERPGETAAETLGRIGRTLIAMFARPEHVALVRTVMAVAPKFPSVGRAFYEAGPQYGAARLAGLLDRLVAAGELDIADTHMAAVQFLNLCQSDFVRRLMFCVDDGNPRFETDAVVASAVHVFLAAYGRR